MRSFLCCSLLVLFSLTQADRCPAGSIDYGDGAECVLPINSNSQFPVAQQICNLIGGQVIQIQNYFENVLASSQIQQMLGGAPSYIGVVKNSSGAWTYADGSPLIYMNWKAGHPLDNATCAVLNGQDFSWYSAQCTDTNPFICTFPDQRCPSGWVLNSQLKSCYLFSQTDLANPLIYNYTGAEMICQYMGGHLTSIHSSDEEAFLRSSIKTNWTGIDCGLLQAVIGLKCSSYNYYWSDGTAFNFDLTEGHCNYVWGIQNDKNCPDYKKTWDYWDSAHQFLRFICKQPINDSQTRKIALLAKLGKSIQKHN
ncbi:unnamed protein product, partial [Mesorhabditis belari]|uniref:C-type lectin domain-containing protein n=1 Tax=Mesorhabditis belari TaxID=2138241 RepID=A0AAF3EMN5_9BILA